MSDIPTVGGDEFEDLVARALEGLEAEGAAAVDALCAEHPDHAEELRRRIVHLRELGLAPTRPERAEDRARTVAAPAPGQVIDGYVLESRLGQGGMGEVWLARQTEPVRRMVALKLIRAGAISRQAVGRFAHERHLLARMAHSGIARIFDASPSDAVCPYFVMEYVNGEPVTAFADRCRMPLHERVELLARICDAVQHAHQNGVLHRDLKPSNVLVVAEDGKAHPKVIDFGIAKLVEADDGGDLARQTMQTESGQILGTIDYMSPEQAAAGEQPVDTRSDVYALGVIGFELCVGRHPLGFDEARERSPWSRLEAIRTREPMPPAAALRTSPQALQKAELRGFRSSGGLLRAVRGDLARVLRACMAKDPKRRYASAGAVAGDLRRFLAREPLLLEPPGVTYVLTRFVARHRLMASAAAVVLVVVAAALMAVIRFAAREAIARADFDDLAHLEERSRLEEVARRLLSVPPGERHDTEGLRSFLARADEVRAAVEARLVGFVSDDARDRVLHDALQRLRGRLAGNEFSTLLERARRAIAWTDEVEQATLVDEAEAWQNAIAAIAASPRYGGLGLTPQLGLIPLGENPQGLWEFRLWIPGGTAPSLDDENAVINPAVADPVLVLVPGGRVTVGSQSSEPDAPFYYADAFVDEEPPVALRLKPYFIGKHETTQGQWLALTGHNPSVMLPQGAAPERAVMCYGDQVGVMDLRLPLNGVAKDAARFVLRCYGLDLPTEAQWEHAARGGSTTPWPLAGSTIQQIVPQLASIANFADRSAKAGALGIPYYHDEVDDGFIELAPVGSLAPNDFGLHDFLGNVWEPCRDGYVDSPSVPRADDGTGRVLAGDSSSCAYRGGSFRSHADWTRSAKRQLRPVTTAQDSHGIRIARDLQDR